jgi:hypothetical protein
MNIIVKLAAACPQATGLDGYKADLSGQRGVL